MNYEIKEILQQKDLNDNVVKVIGKVYISDEAHGIRAVDIVLDGVDLETIMALPIEEQKAAFITWLEPKIELDYNDWISSIVKPAEVIWVSAEPSTQNNSALPSTEPSTQNNSALPSADANIITSADKN